MEQRIPALQKPHSFSVWFFLSLSSLPFTLSLSFSCLLCLFCASSLLLSECKLFNEHCWKVANKIQLKNFITSWSGDNNTGNCSSQGHWGNNGAAMDPLPSCPQLFTTHFMKFHAIVSCHSAQAANSTSKVQRGRGRGWHACYLCWLPTNVWQINADNVVSNDSPYSWLPLSASLSTPVVLEQRKQMRMLSLHSSWTSIIHIDRQVRCHMPHATPIHPRPPPQLTAIATPTNLHTLTYTLTQRMFCRPNSLLVWIFGARFFRHFRPFVCPLMGLRPI